MIYSVCSRRVKLGVALGILTAMMIFCTACPLDPKPTTSNPTTSSTTAPTETIAPTETTAALLILPLESEIYEGSSYQLILSGNAGSEMNWSSSDESIATVDPSGLLTAVIPGEVTISVQETASGRSDSISITILEREQAAEKGDLVYEYDILGRVTKVAYPDGSTVTYEYDANGNITSVLKG